MWYHSDLALALHRSRALRPPRRRRAGAARTAPERLAAIPVLRPVPGER